MDLMALILTCAPALDPALAVALIERESGRKPYAIGMDSKHGVRLVRQPKNLAEAVSTADALARSGYSFSVGLTQIHINHVRRLKWSWQDAFTPCKSLAQGQRVLQDFYTLAHQQGLQGQAALQAALRGYNSGHLHASVSAPYANAIVSRYIQLKSHEMSKITYQY